MITFKNYLEQKLDGEERGALIPIYREGDLTEILLMKPSDPRFGGSSFQVAKGKIDPGESQLETALREGREELGYIHKDNYKVQLLWNNIKNRIAYYFVIVDDKKLDLHDFETETVKWVNIQDAQNIIRDWQKPLITMLKRRLGVK